MTEVLRILTEVTVDGGALIVCLLWAICWLLEPVQPVQEPMAFDYLAEITR